MVVWTGTGLLPLVGAEGVGGGRAGPPRSVLRFLGRHLHWRLGRLAPAGTRSEQLLRSPQSGPVLIRPSFGSSPLGLGEEKSVPVWRWAGPRHTWTPCRPWGP